MSAQECTAALKIQDAWREWKESKDSCPICLKIIGEDSCKTKCGHKFCTGCLLKSVQRNGSCPLCRDELIGSNGDEEVDAVSYQFNLSDQDYENAVNESFDASYLWQCVYAEGFEKGKRETKEEWIARYEALREDCNLFEERLKEKIKDLEEKNKEIRISKHRMYEELQDDLDKKDEEIKRLKQRNSRLREDLQFATQPTREVYIR